MIIFPCSFVKRFLPPTDRLHRLRPVRFANALRRRRLKKLNFKANRGIITWIRYSRRNRMLNEFEYLYNIYCDVSMFDASGAMKPDAYQRICVNVVERHLNAIELDVERLVAAYGVSWVLLGLTVQVLRPFKPGETITARTRHTNRKGAAYRRDIILCDESGGTVALAASFSSSLSASSKSS